MNGIYITILILLFLSLYFIIPKKEYFNQCTPNCYSHNLIRDRCSANSANSANSVNIICPSNPSCVGQCLNMFTWTDNTSNGAPVTMGELKDENDKDIYFSSRCNECIDNFYDGMYLINTPNEQRCTARAS